MYGNARFIYIYTYFISIDLTSNIINYYSRIAKILFFKSYIIIVTRHNKIAPSL